MTPEKQQRLISTIAASDASYCRPSVTASHREFVTSAKKSRILRNFPKLKKFVKIRTTSNKPTTTTEEFDAFHGFMLIKI